MIKCVVFDLDDTLYSEIDYCKSGFRAIADMVAKDFGLNADDVFARIWEMFSAGNRNNLFNQILDCFSLSYDQDYIISLVKAYRSHFPDIKLPAESLEVLHHLRKKYQLALLSDGFLPAQELKTKALGIEDFFSCIVYTEKLGREFWKPSTKGFEVILDQLGLQGDECVYIADNPIKDFIGPNKLGFVTIQYINPDSVHHNEPATELAKPDHIITSLTELPGMLNSIAV